MAGHLRLKMVRIGLMASRFSPIDRRDFLAGMGAAALGAGLAQASAGETLIYPASSALTAAEAEILRHMAADHADAVNLYANRILGFPGDDWRLTGIDPEGIDLRRGGRVERLDFEASVSDASAARAALVRLANLARQRP